MRAWWLCFLLVGCASAPPEKPKVETRRLTPKPLWVKACRSDYRKLCAVWDRRDGSPMDCLARQEKDLSGRCYQELRAAAPPCVFDRARLCGHLRPTDSSVGVCLDARPKEVSASCRAHRDGVKTHARNLQQACGGDRARLCGEGATGWKCLRENLQSLSPACRNQWAQSLGPRGPGG